MDIIVDGEELIKYVTIMLNYIEEYQNEVLNINLLKNKVIWESAVSEKIINKYDEITGKYLKFAQGIFEYVIFINKMLDNYSDGIDEIKEKFDRIENKFKNYEGDANGENKS